MMTVDTTTHPARRKIELLEFPHYWLNSGNVVYVATSPACPGYLWSSKARCWCACAQDTALVDHVKVYPETYKSIVQLRAFEEFGAIPIHMSLTALELKLKEDPTIQEREQYTDGGPVNAS